ncbi:MAG: pilus assembly PilX N-terminal domain-containing protein [Acidimicrobiia bacterium]
MIIDRQARVRRRLLSRGRAGEAIVAHVSHCPSEGTLRSEVWRSQRLKTAEQGTVLIMTLFAMLILTALGSSLVLITLSEMMISTNHRNAKELFYGADLGIDIVLHNLRVLPDWNGVLAGSVRSSLVDGPPVGPRTLADGTTFDLLTATAALQAESDAFSSWGRDNPVWRLYAHAPAAGLLPGQPINSACYVLVWVADDQAESDGAALVDSNDTLWLHSEARGPEGTRKAVEATVVRRAGPMGVGVTSWRELRQ